MRNGGNRILTILEMAHYLKTKPMQLELRGEPSAFSLTKASVDTPFLIVLKTWMSPFEHSVIIHVCVRLEFPEVSATRLASGSLDSTVLCLVLH